MAQVLCKAIVFVGKFLGVVRTMIEPVFEVASNGFLQPYTIICYGIFLALFGASLDFIA
jgi:hypothetical protein